MAAAASSATVASSAYSLPARKRVSINVHRVRIPIPFSRFSSHARRRLLVVRSSGEEGAAAVDEGEPPQTPAEVPKGPPSLISTLNVEKALRGIVAAITDADHYGRLGLPAKCSYDEVNVAYKSKVTELTSRGLDEEELSKELELLKESYSILSTPEERRLYDWSLARSEKPDTYVWPFEVDSMREQLGDPPPQEPEDELPTTYTGYFFLGWLTLSILLYLVFNR